MKLTINANKYQIWGISIYLVIYLLSVCYAIYHRYLCDEFAGIFMTITTLPWSMLILPVAILFPSFVEHCTNTFGIAFGLSLCSLGAVLNCWIIFFFGKLFRC